METFIEGTSVGVIGGGKKKPTGQIDVATYQSLINKNDNTVSNLIREYGQVIIDECHHISAPRYEMLLNEVSARYVVGLTARMATRKLCLWLRGRFATKFGLNQVPNLSNVSSCGSVMKYHLPIFRRVANGLT